MQRRPQPNLERFLRREPVEAPGDASLFESDDARLARRSRPRGNAVALARHCGCVLFFGWVAMLKLLDDIAPLPVLVRFGG